MSPDNGPLCVGFERLDQRMTSLLLQAVPKSIKDEIIATRELTTAAILFRVMRAYQPGGLIEKSRLLEDLTMVPTTKSAQEVVAALRLWKRKGQVAHRSCVPNCRSTFTDPNSGWYREASCGWVTSSQLSHCLLQNELQLGHQAVHGERLALL